MMLRHGGSQRQHPAGVMSWSVLSAPPCSHFILSHQDKTTRRGKFLGAGALGEEASGCILAWLGLLMCLWSILRLQPRGTKQPLTQGRDQLQNKSLVGDNPGKRQVSLCSEQVWQHPRFPARPILSWVLAFPRRELIFFFFFF